MAKQAWIFQYGAGSTVFTSDVLSFSGNWGRQNYLDDYAGGGFSVTIKNNTNQVASFIRGTPVQIKFSNSNSAFAGRVTTVDYNDYPGDTGLSTATIRCIDFLSEGGKFTLQNFNYTATDTLSQAIQTNDFPPTRPFVFTVGTGASTASGTASSYNGTILNRLNILNNTERGQLKSLPSGVIGFLSRKEIGTSSTTVSLKRTGDLSTVISYTDFRRVGLGDNFMNQVNVTPETVAAQLSDNTASQTAYGISGYTVNTADSTTTQAAGLASWLSTMQGDPATLQYEVDFDDVSCNATAFYTYMNDMLDNISISLGTLEWQAQGQSLQTVQTILEGMSISGTPNQTNVTVYLSPIEYYSYFILDSDTFGILGGDGITYDQPEIVYDETGWIYNDANVEQGSRLGW